MQIAQMKDDDDGDKQEDSRKKVCVDGFVFNVTNFHETALKNPKEFRALWNEALAKRQWGQPTDGEAVARPRPAFATTTLRKRRGAKKTNTSTKSVAVTQQQQQRRHGGGGAAAMAGASTSRTASPSSCPLTEEALEMMVGSLLSRHSVAARVKTWTIVLLDVLGLYASPTQLPFTTATQAPLVSLTTPAFYLRLTRAMYQSGASFTLLVLFSILTCVCACNL